MTSLSSLPLCGLCGEPVREHSMLYDNRKVHEECHGKLEGANSPASALADNGNGGRGAEARGADAGPVEPREGAEGALRDASAVSGAGEQNARGSGVVFGIPPNRLRIGYCSTCTATIEPNETARCFRIKCPMEIVGEQREARCSVCSWRGAVADLDIECCPWCHAHASVIPVGDDPVNPPHYKGDYVMRIIEDFDLGFTLGNVVKYVLRAKEKGGAEDLQKASWYLSREIERAGK
jgi:Protein of unknwon function (DUF3310)